MSRGLVVFYVAGLWSLGLVLVGLLSRSGEDMVCPASWYRILAIVPAHDEESTVMLTVRSLEAAGCVVVVVADRCTDGTVALVRGEGVMCYEVDQGNKGRAINEFLDASVLPAGFAGVAVVDCGGVVGPDFAGRVLDALSEAPFVQSWLRSSGRRSWVSCWYFWNYGLYHLTGLGRSALGLPAMLGGCGFAWRSSERVRFNGECLTEDLELSLRLHAGRVRVVYRDLRVTDEKPWRLGDSVRQRVRWARGGWWLLFHGRWFTWRLDDLVAVLGSCSSLIWGCFLGYGLFRAPVVVLMCTLAYVIIGCAGLVRLGELGHFSWSLLVSVPLMSILEGFISLWALLTFNRKLWVRTPHCIAEVAEHSG